MKRTLFLLIFISLYLFCINIYGQTIIPQPQELSLGKDIFLLNKNIRIVYTDTLLQREAHFLQKEIKGKYGYQLTIDSYIAKKNQILLHRNPQLKNSEYNITVTKNNVICEASSAEGIFYGMQTVLQSVEEYKTGKYCIPSFKTHDSPRYGWRGLMVDFSRHFFDKKTVKSLLDVMAYLKMNRFHMHLTDENGWRVEIKKYPRLTTIGAEGNWHDRKAPPTFFTQDDIREIVAYAAERHIMVIPEIDMPGHASAASRAYPEISAGGEGRWEGFTFHPAKEQTYQFIDDVLTEIVELFPAPYIHIGGDEVHYGNKIWFTDPGIQNFIKENNLGNEVGLEHYFIRRACDIIHSKGKKMIGWDEIIASGVTPDKAIVMWWRHDKPDQLTAALEKGFDVIMTPRLPCYFDFVQDNSQKTGRRWGKDYNTLENVYKFPDNIDNIISGHQDQIMGLQASAWAERIADTKRLYYMLFPRLAAIAEDGWTNKEKKNYTGFEERVKPFLKYLDSKNINYFNPFDIDSTPEPWGPNKADVIAEG